MVQPERNQYGHPWQDGYGKVDWQRSRCKKSGRTAFSCECLYVHVYVYDKNGAPGGPM